jgi:hypothetical protein
MPWWQGPTYHDAMPWWQGPSYHGKMRNVSLFCHRHKGLNLMSLTQPATLGISKKINRFWLWNGTNVQASNRRLLQGGSNMTGTNCDLFTHKSSRSYLNHLVKGIIKVQICT